MTQPASYETDYLRWLDTQARHLRAGELDRLDRVHLLEELEGMSRSERRQLRNRLIVLVQHLLKMRHQPQRPSRSWDVTVITQRVDIKLLMKESPSLRPTLAATLEDIYANARREAARETGLDIDRFPAQCPFTPRQVLDDEWWPDAEKEPQLTGTVSDAGSFCGAADVGPSRDLSGTASARFGLLRWQTATWSM